MILHTEIKSKPGVKNFYFDRDEKVKKYFSYLTDLINDGYPLNICLAYCFYRLEVAHNTAIYCGIVKLHRTDSSLTKKVVDNWDMYRSDFINKFELVHGKKIPVKLVSSVEETESVRDDVMHGSSKSAPQKRRAIGIVLRYAEELNEFVDDEAGIKPFSDDLREFKGRASSLDKKTTRWILKGMGFNVG